MPSLRLRPARCLFTSGPSLQIYRILGKTVVCYPIIFDLSDFYMSQDVLLLIDDIKVASEPPYSNGATSSRLILSCCQSERSRACGSRATQALEGEPEGGCFGNHVHVTVVVYLFLNTSWARQIIFRTMSSKALTSS